MAELLRLDSLSLSFGALKVIDGLSLSLAQGEALGVLGPNGAGKSSLFNLITGDLRAASGTIHFRGRNITASPAHVRSRQGIGRSYQIPHPFGGMTVFENLLVAAAFSSGRPERACHASCVDVLERTGLAAKANATAGVLTLLDRKRLELARALATDPKLLLLDEIAGGLSEGESQALVGMIGQLRADGISIVWVEHVVPALLAVVDRLVVLNFGRKLAEGGPRAVMRDPAVQEVYMGIGAA